MEKLATAFGLYIGICGFVPTGISLDGQSIEGEDVVVIKHKGKGAEKK